MGYRNEFKALDCPRLFFFAREARRVLRVAVAPPAGNPIA